MNIATQLNDEQQDCLKEVINVAMGQAGSNLATLLNVFIQLSVPKISMISASELSENMISLIGTAEQVTITRQGFYSDSDTQGLTGEVFVLFTDNSFTATAELLNYESVLDSKSLEELVLDVSNLLTCACMGGIAEQLDTQIAYTPPSIVTLNSRITSVVEPEQIRWEEAMIMEVTYTLEDREFQCNLLFMLPSDTINFVKEFLNNFMDSL